jgi:hypothetical protein
MANQGCQRSWRVWVMLAILMVSGLSAGHAGTGLLDRVHERHSAIYRHFHRESTALRPGVVQVVSRLDLDALAADPIWTRYLEELPRLSYPQIEAAPLNDRVAFWLNVRTVGMVLALLEGSKIPDWNREPTLSALPLWHSQKVDLAGRTMTLAQIDAVIESLEEPLTVFGITEGTATGPPWPAEPYRSNAWREQLVAQGRHWLANPEVWTVNHGRRTVTLSRDFQTRTPLLTKMVHAVALERTVIGLPQDQAILLSVLLPVLPDADARLIRSARYKVNWMPAGDGILLFRP